MGFCSTAYPGLLIYWLYYERKMSKQDYLIGYDDGKIARSKWWEKKHRQLFDELKHGDPEHQAWLKKKIDDYFESEYE